MLSVHLYRYSQFKRDLAQDRQLISVDKRNKFQVQQGPQTAREEENITGEEEVMMIPVEDVIRITYRSEMKKDGQTDVKSTTTPVYKMGENCCDRCCCCCSDENKIIPVARDTTTIIVSEDSNRDAHVVEEHLPLPEDDGGCCTNFFNRFRCWCCRKNVLVDLIKRTNISMEQQAQRMITVSIEYSKYSNLDSSSNARLLSREEQEAYYRRRFDPDTKLEFYLINDTEFDPKNFEIKRQQAEGLCRTVMQLKAMAGDYPSENELDSILDQPYRRTLGDPYIEPKLQLPLAQQTQLPLPLFQPRAIE